MVSESVETLVIANGKFLDVVAGAYLPHRNIAVRGNTILGFDYEWDPADTTVRVVDASGCTVLPGLMDAHVHPAFCSLDMRGQELDSATYIAMMTARNLAETQQRGFTTIRDLGGVDFGIVRALEHGLIPGPRTFFCGKMISQSGGHGDLRERGYRGPENGAVSFPVSTIADGVAEVRRAARNELRLGADHIKIAVSGGVGSTTDRIDSLQFANEEIDAIVEEATNANRYVAAHAYTAASIERALLHGVRSIEHGNLIDERGVELLVEKDAFLVPTLVTYAKMRWGAGDLGLPKESIAKLDGMLERGLEALALADKAGVNVVFGTDLLGEMQPYQSHEFLLRAEVQSNAAVLRSATVTSARLMGIEATHGQLRPGYVADIVVVKGDALADLSNLADPAENLVFGVQDGVVFRDEMASLAHS